MFGFACRYLLSGDRTKYRMFISRHLAYGVFLPVSGADFIMLYHLVSAPFFMPCPAGYTLPRPGISAGPVQYILRTLLKVQKKNRYKMTAFRVFLFLSGLSGQSGKLTIFLYPFLSTGESLKITPIGISGDLNVF